MSKKIIYNSIVLSASMFGCIYLFSTSLKGLNNRIEQSSITQSRKCKNGDCQQSWQQVERDSSRARSHEVFYLAVLNGSILFISGGILLSLFLNNLIIKIDLIN